MNARDDHDGQEKIEEKCVSMSAAMDARAFEDLIEKIISNKADLIHLAYNQINTEQFNRLSEALKVNVSVTELKISYFRLSQEQLINLAKALETHPLMELFILSYNSFIESLSSPKYSLTNTIGVMMESFCMMPNLKILDLNSNMLSKESILIIARALENNNTILELKLNGNIILGNDDLDVDVANALLKMLCVNWRLESLELPPEICRYDAGQEVMRKMSIQLELNKRINAFLETHKFMNVKARNELFHLLKKKFPGQNVSVACPSLFQIVSSKVMSEIPKTDSSQLLPVDVLEQFTRPSRLLLFASFSVQQNVNGQAHSLQKLRLDIQTQDEEIKEDFFFTVARKL